MRINYLLQIIQLINYVDPKLLTCKLVFILTFMYYVYW